MGQGRQLACGRGEEQGRTDEGLHGREVQRPYRPPGGEPADQRHMAGPYDGGGEHQQVPEAGRVEAVARHQEPDGQDAHTGGGVEGGRQTAPVTGAVEKGVRTMVRLMMSPALPALVWATP